MNAPEPVSRTSAEGTAPLLLLEAAGDEFPWLEQVARHRGWESVERRIARADEMLEFSWRDGGDLDAAVLDYFCSGERVAATVLALCEQWFPDDLEAVHLLDFGGGYGRVTRFFAHQLGAHRVATSDVLGGAVDFARQVLDVEAFLSAELPERLVAPRRYQVIYAGSLFTHLPDATFTAWLARLLELLESDGLLIFTTHGEELLPPEREMPTSGFSFEAASESHELDHAQYGSTWITEAALMRRVSAAGGVARRFPRGLCGYQDLVVACRTAHGQRSSRLEELELDPGARTHIERCELRSGSRRGRDPAALELQLSGWSIHGSKRGAAAEIQGIDVWMATDGDLERLGETTRLEMREELVEALDLPPGTPAGWSLSVPLPAPLRRSRALLLVETRTAVSTVSYVGGLERLLYLATRENYLRHRQRVYELAEIIEAMKQSWFWRLRRRWFGLKRALGLTQEDPAGPPITATDRRPSSTAGSASGSKPPGAPDARRSASTQPTSTGREWRGEETR